MKNLFLGLALVITGLVSAQDMPKGDMDMDKMEMTCDSLEMIIHKQMKMVKMKTMKIKDLKMMVMSKDMKIKELKMMLDSLEMDLHKAMLNEKHLRMLVGPRILKKRDAMVEKELMN